MVEHPRVDRYAFEKFLPLSVLARFELCLKILAYNCNDVIVRACIINEEHKLDLLHYVIDGCYIDPEAIIVNLYHF